MVESRFEALRTAATPLVGREEEFDLLLDAGSRLSVATVAWY
jgi:hypothetical protein